MHIVCREMKTVIQCNRETMGEAECTDSSSIERNQSDAVVLSKPSGRAWLFGFFQPFQFGVLLSQLLLHRFQFFSESAQFGIACSRRRLIGLDRGR